MSKIFWVLLGGLGAGYVNGLLGTGGGIVLVFVLNKLLDGDNKDIYALTLTVTLALSFVSLFVYVKNGNVGFGEGVKYGTAAIPGGLIGAYLLDRLDGKVVKRMFAVLLVIAGINMSGLI